jgi:hypothetical protein
MMQYMKNADATEHIGKKFKEIFQYAGQEG